MKRLFLAIAAWVALACAPAFAETVYAGSIASGGGGGCSTTCNNTGLLSINPGSNVGSLALTYNTTGSSAAHAIDITGTWNTSGATAAIYANMTYSVASNAAFISFSQSAVGGEVFRVSATGNVTLWASSKLGWVNWGTLGPTADGDFEFLSNGGSKGYHLKLQADQQLSLQGGLVNKVRVVTAAGAVTVAVSDYVVVVNKTTGAATTVNLPTSPATGFMLLVKDGKGDAATNNITITPAAGTIDGASTKVINTNYGAVQVVYNGTEWNVL